MALDKYQVKEVDGMKTVVKVLCKNWAAPKIKQFWIRQHYIGELQTSAEIAIAPNSDIYQLPFKVASEQLMAAMVSTTAPVDGRELGGCPQVNP